MEYNEAVEGPVGDLQFGLLIILSCGWYNIRQPLGSARDDRLSFNKQ